MMSSIVPDLELPILPVDEEHWQKAGASAKEASEYAISSYEGFRLSTAGFRFTIPLNADYNTPNIIQLIVGKEQLYASAYEPDCTLYTITPNNLVPMYGSKPLKKFMAGQKIIIAIGHLTPPRQDLPQPKFTVLWAGVVNIL
jgi:hypothetical protein